MRSARLPWRGILKRKGHVFESGRVGCPFKGGDDRVVGLGGQIKDRLTKGITERQFECDGAVARTDLDDLVLDLRMVDGAVAHLVEIIFRDIERHYRHIEERVLGVRELDQRRIISVPHRSRLSGLGREEVRRLARRNASRRREVNFSGLENDHAVLVDASLARGLARHRVGKLGRVVDAMQIGEVRIDQTNSPDSSRPFLKGKVAVPASRSTMADFIRSTGPR
jgi:hypothetical protein